MKVDSATLANSPLYCLADSMKIMSTKTLYAIAYMLNFALIASADSSSVSVYGGASIPGGESMNYGYSLPFSGSVSGSVSTFDPRNPTHTSSASSSATQTSSITDLGFTFAQSFSCNYSPYFSLTAGGMAYAGAATVFQVTFVVVQAVNYQLNLSYSGSGGSQAFAYATTFQLGSLALLSGVTSLRHAASR